MIEQLHKTIPLVTVWDYWGKQNFGMAQFFRGLQGNGDVLQFQQCLFKAKLGVKVPPILDPVMQHFWAYHNKPIMRQLQQGPWILGGQQFLYLFSKANLSTATVVVYDLLALDYPNVYATPKMLARYKSKLANLVHAAQIVTISHYSKQRIMAHFDVDPQKIAVVNCGVDLSRFRHLDSQERLLLRTKLGIGPDVFVVLYVGSEQRRKNVTTLVSALAALKRSIPKLLFVKVGEAQSSVGRQNFIQALDESGLRNFCKIVDYVPDDEIAEWYAIANVFAFPSVGEGFGVPLLEAMASGVPIVTTRCCSIPEVAGDVAWYVEDPFDVDEWRQTIVDLVQDVNLQKERVEVGVLRAAQFDWVSLRNRFLSVIRGE